MNAFIHYLLWPLNPVNVGGMAHALGEFLISGNIYFWCIAIIMARFVVPDVALWFATVFFRERVTGSHIPPRPTRGPLVSVLIAGRNVGDGIVRTMHSVRECGYPNVEIIFVDDFSTDHGVAQARMLEKNGRVKVFSPRNHNGKPTSLNIGLGMARGEFIFILDADCELQPGIVQHLLAPFRDPAVGAVAANLRVRNADASLIATFQEIEYALNDSVSRMWRARMGLLAILPGAGSMFRADAVRALGGYDTGLGDDTDLTVRMMKQGWKLRFALDAVVWTDVPETLRALVRQRSRWERNMVKVRLHKHDDLYKAWRYGLNNALVFLDVVVFRVVVPLWIFMGLLMYTLFEPLTQPDLLTWMFWLTWFLMIIKMLIAHDIACTPRLKLLWMAPFYPFYRLPIRITEMVALLRETFRVALWHPYVPKRIWARIPHW